MQLPVVSDGPIFSLAREKIGEKRVLLLRNRHHVSTQKRDGLYRPPLLPIYASLPKDPVIVGDGGVGAEKICSVRLRAQTYVGADAYIGPKPYRGTATFG